MSNTPRAKQAEPDMEIFLQSQGHNQLASRRPISPAAPPPHPDLATILAEFAQAGGNGGAVATNGV